MLNASMLQRLNNLLEEELDPNIQVTADEAWQIFQETMLEEDISLPVTPVISRKFAALAYSIDAMPVPPELARLLLPPEPITMMNQVAVKSENVIPAITTSSLLSMQARATQSFSMQPKQAPAPKKKSKHSSVR